MRTAEWIFDTKHDRYPVASHLFLIDAAERVLFMRRAGSGYADGQLGVPAGHVDLGETVTESIIRETGEELGIKLNADDLVFAGTMFRRSQEPRVDYFFTARTWEGDPEIREPHKCTELVWAAAGDLPADVIPYLVRALDNARTGTVFDEHGW